MERVYFKIQPVSFDIPPRLCKDANLSLNGHWYIRFVKSSMMSARTILFKNDTEHPANYILPFYVFVTYYVKIRRRLCMSSLINTSLTAISDR